ncbi:hypothetical protein RHODGE_RHODGE_03525 [Rhodoplanes serenus]|uniref:AAA+ ATPase domain-containing protein n=2 Tax=Nitrobacteraceae TaxID=41294 RepID=A0A3S4B6F1_9BRAD|nr:hypothetical protein RHODGE_RHODGE_03525 [Rhodoplanes serenus]
MERLDRFRSILIPHPRMKLVKQRLLALRAETMSAAAANERRVAVAKGRPVKLEEFWILPIVGPSGATKSKSMSVVVDEILADPNLSDDEIPVLVVTLKSSIKSTRALQAAILEAYGDPSASDVLVSRSYNEARINREIGRIAKEKRTFVVVLDEAHNLLIDAGINTARSMAGALKSLVNDAVFSIAILGTDKMLPLFTAEPELRSRRKETISLTAFDIAVKEDRQYFFGFAAKLERKMLDDGVVDAPIGLVESVEARAILYDMTGGVIGLISRILRLALQRAFEKDRTTPDWNDIEASFRSWMELSDDEVFYDPFAKGARPDTLEAVREDQ